MILPKKRALVYMKAAVFSYHYLQNSSFASPFSLCSSVSLTRQVVAKCLQLHWRSNKSQFGSKALFCLHKHSSSSCQSNYLQSWGKIFSSFTWRRNIFAKERAHREENVLLWMYDSETSNILRLHLLLFIQHLPITDCCWCLFFFHFYAYCHPVTE